MNCTQLVGRLTKDLELKQTQSGKSFINFTIAVNRKFKDDNGNYQADFINCVCWGQPAEYLSSHAHKGDLISAEGSIQTRTYEGQNGKVYITEVNCNNVSILINQEKEQLKKQLNNDKLEHLPINGNFGNSGIPVGDTVIEQEDLPFYGG